MKALCAVFLIVFAATVQAEVKESNANLFVVERTLTTTRAPAAAYTVLTRQVGKWWDGEHTWSGNARNLSIDARAGGCFCEKLGAGGSVAHGRVIWAQPGKMLRLEAALGPLQDMAVSAVLSFKLEPAGTGTKITMTYRAAGTFTMESAKLAPLVDRVLGVQLARLQAFADTGSPINKK